MTEVKTVGEGAVHIGKKTELGENVTIIFHKKANVFIGDYVRIGKNVKIICDGGDVFIGDWTTLHDSVLVLSKTGVRIAEHCWFGQNTILDGTGGLVIENGVRVGMYSQIWTHVAAGEQIEGCVLYGERPVKIESDVWLVGSCIVASGVSLGRRTVALIGSNITKSFPALSVIAGTPAQKKENLNFYKQISIEEKFRLLNEWVTQFKAEYSCSNELEIYRDDNKIVLTNFFDGQKEVLTFLKLLSQFEKYTPTLKETVCCIESKRYTKSFSKLEGDILKYLSNNKARFYQELL